MNNSQIKYNLARKKKIKERIRLNEAKIKRLQKQLRKDEDIIYQIEDSVIGKIEVYRNKHLDINHHTGIHGKCCEVNPVGDWTNRYAEVYAMPIIMGKHMVVT